MDRISDRMPHSAGLRGSPRCNSCSVCRRRESPRSCTEWHRGLQWIGFLGGCLIRIARNFRTFASAVGVRVCRRRNFETIGVREHVRIHVRFEFWMPTDRVLTPAALADARSFGAAGVSTRSHLDDQNEHNAHGVSQSVQRYHRPDREGGRLPALLSLRRFIPGLVNPVPVPLDRLTCTDLARSGNVGERPPSRSGL